MGFPENLGCIDAYGFDGKLINRIHRLKYNMAPKRSSGTFQVLIDDPLPPGFAEQWTTLHPALAAVLSDEGISVGDYADAKFLANPIFTTEKEVERWLDTSYKYVRLHKEREAQKTQIRQQLTKLLILAKRTPPIEMLSETGRSRMQEAPRKPHMYQKSDIPIKELTKWRSIKPPDLADIAKKGPSIRLLENELARRWRTRILDKLAPHHKHLPNLARAMKNTNQELALHDLFGKTRGGTLAIHGRTLDCILKHAPSFIPWDTDKVAALLDNIRESNDKGEVHYNANKPAVIWKTIHFLSHLTGLHTDLDMPYLRNKRDADGWVHSE